MIPNVLIDTDVLLDVFLEREPHYTNSKNVLYMLDDGGFHGFITATIVVNVFYHVEKYKNLERAFASVERLLTNPDLVVLGVNKSILMKALYSGFRDDRLRGCGASDSGKCCGTRLYRNPKPTGLSRLANYRSIAGGTFGKIE